MEKPVVRELIKEVEKVTPYITEKIKEIQLHSEKIVVNHVDKAIVQ